MGAIHLQDARRLLAQLGVPDLDGWLRDGWQSLETGPHWALEQDLVKMPPQRTEFPDEDTLARYPVHQRLWLTGPRVPTAPAPARPWSVVREDLDDGTSGGPGLRWSTRLVTGSTCTTPDPGVLLVRDLSSWWDHLLDGAAVIRTVAPATGEQIEARVDNDLFALGSGPTPELGRRPPPPTPLPGGPVGWCRTHGAPTRTSPCRWSSGRCARRPATERPGSSWCSSRTSGDRRTGPSCRSGAPARADLARPSCMMIERHRS